MKNRREFISASAIGLAGLGLPFVIKASEPINPLLVEIAGKITQCYNTNNELFRNGLFAQIFRRVGVQGDVIWELTGDAFCYPRSFAPTNPIASAKPLKIKDYQVINSQINKNLQINNFSLEFVAYGQELINNGTYKVEPEPLYNCRIAAEGIKVELLCKKPYMTVQHYVNNPNMI